MSRHQSEPRRLLAWVNRWLGRPSDQRRSPALPASSNDGVDGLAEAVVAGVPDPVVVLDQDGRVVAFNAEARTIAPALRRGELALIALRTPELVEAIRQAQETGRPQRVKFTRAAPAMMWMEAFVTPVSAGAESQRLTVITVHDLTSVQRAEMMRADFVANASHELRTPLAALTGFIETLQSAARDDAAARDRFLAIMHEQAWRMARLIDDLLSLSRIEQHAHLPPETSVDVVAIVRQVTDALQTLARDRDVAIEVSAPNEPLIALGDRDELVRLFENLIENALKYGVSGKRVDVSVSSGIAARGREAQVAVRDYGPGIAPEHLPRLTERFYRVDVAESRAHGGTGLGLALVKHILNRHRGRLTIASTPGAGATFTAHVPLLEGSATSDRRPA